MKKSFKSLLTIALVSMAIASCGDSTQNNDSTAKSDSAKTNDKSTGAGNNGDNGALEPLSPIEFKNMENIDTLSYALGCDLGNFMKKGLNPYMKLDHKSIISSIKEYIEKRNVKVEGITITDDNILEISQKHFGNELPAKLDAAMKDSTGKTEVFTPQEKSIVSAIIGIDMVSGLIKNGIDVEANSFVMGMTDSFDGEKKMNDQAIQSVIINESEKKAKELADNNARESQEWLAGIEKQNGVKKTASGLLYKIVKSGDTGKKATKDTDVVKVLYTGKTRKDVTFDSNRWIDMPQQRQEMIKAYQPDQANKDNPIEFPLNGVIPGWTEGMKLVGKGGRIHLWIPAELAYKEMGAGQDIGPNEALFFDVELLEVTPAK